MGWKMYDQQFRLKQERTPSRSWAEIDMELWVTVASGPAFRTPSSPAHFPPPLRKQNLGIVLPSMIRRAATLSGAGTHMLATRVLARGMVHFSAPWGDRQASQMHVPLTSNRGASRTNPLLLLLVNLLEIRSRLQPLPSMGKTLFFRPSDAN